jgi:hypothetical protein
VFGAALQVPPHRLATRSRTLAENGKSDNRRDPALMAQKVSAIRKRSPSGESVFSNDYSFSLQVTTMRLASQEAGTGNPDEFTEAPTAGWVVFRDRAGCGGSKRGGRDRGFCLNTESWPDRDGCRRSPLVAAGNVWLSSRWRAPQSDRPDLVCERWLAPRTGGYTGEDSHQSDHGCFG